MRRVPLLAATFMGLSFSAMGVSLSAAPGSAQQADRVARIESAAAVFDFEEAVRQLMPLIDPNFAGRDSVWSNAVKAMATVLLDDGLENARPDAALAEVLLRWGARHSAGITLDPVYDLQAVRSAYDAASRSLVEDPDTLVAVVTEWDWVTVFDGSADGRLSVQLGVEGTSQVSLTAGGRSLSEDGPTALPPGTYEVEIAAEGYESVTLQREVLPGVTTRLEVELAPLLLPEARERAGARVAQVAYDVAAGRICTNGLALAPFGLALVPEMAGATGLERVGVPADQAPLGGVRLSPDNDIVVASPRVSMGVAAQYASASPGTYAWALYRADCPGDLVEERVVLVAVGTREVQFDRSLDEEAVGGALVDRNGSMLGIVSSADRAIILTRRAQAFLNRAIVAQNEAAEAAEATVGGGLPWAWIGGVGGAGALAAVLLSGGEPPTPTPTPTTGGITLTLPGG